ncbi:MAG: LysR substrate-binding domain-containing protein [Candidatus Binatia bacterium]
MRWSPHPCTLRQLQYVAAIADTRSFRRAADLCAVSQPSLSAQVAQLERALGVRLFERTKRRVLPTGAGEELLARARDVLREADDLCEAATRLTDPFAGTLRLGVIPTISPYLLPEIAPVLRSRYPRLRLLWTEDKTALLTGKLHAGDLDAALVALESDLGDVEHEIVGRDPFVLATPLGHPLGVKTTPATPRDLDGASVLLLDDGHCFREQALAWCTRARAEELDYRATSLATLTQMVAGGAGVTLLPQLSVPTENRRGELRVRPFFAGSAPGRTIVLAWRRGTPLAPALRAITGTIRGVYVRLGKTTRRR